MGKEYLETALKTELELGNKVFIPYIMAGDGGVDELIPTLQRLEGHGATAVEIGIPFSDPVADGPTIQEAGKRALKHGTTLADVLDVLKENRLKVGIPLVFMTYINPIFRYGVSRFFRDCREAGVDGLIIPDLPLEHLDLIEADAVEQGIAIIQLATLTSSEERIKELARRSEGFLYAVTVKGITGARKEFDGVISRHLNLLKEHSPVPVLAGFGISSPDHVKSMSQSCDGVVVGSSIIDLIQEGDEEAIKSLMDASKGVRA